MILSDVAEIYAGHPFRGAVTHSEDGDVRVLQGKDIDAAQVIVWGNVARTRIMSKKEPVWLRSGDIVFAARGARNYSVLLGDVAEKNAVLPAIFRDPLPFDQPRPARIFMLAT